VGFSEVTGGRALSFRNLSMGKQQALVSRYKQGYGCLFFETEEAHAVMLAKDAY